MIPFFIYPSFFVGTDFSPFVIYQIKIIITIIIIRDATHLVPQCLDRYLQKGLNQSSASKKINTIPINIIIINTVFQPPCRKSLSPSFANEPTSKRKKTAKSNKRTTLANAVLIIATSFVDATTKKATTKATNASRFFLVYFLPSISSIPKILVFSRIAKIIVNTNRNGKTTSYIPNSLRNPITSLNTDSSAIYYNFDSLLFKLFYSKGLIQKPIHLNKLIYIVFFNMLNKKDFNDIRKEFNSFDDNRELTIKKSRDILKLSKQIIYSVHRDDLKEAAKLVKKIEVEKKKVEEIVCKNSKLESIGAYRVAIGEYVEAMLYYYFIKNKNIVTHKSLRVTTEHYLMGLIDLTGELGRKAVQLAGKGVFKKVVFIRDAVSDIYGELLKFDFRDSDMRRKFDSVKYDLKKLEDLVLDLKLKGKL